MGGCRGGRFRGQYHNGGGGELQGGGTKFGAESISLTRCPSPSFHFPYLARTQRKRKKKKTGFFLFFGVCNENPPNEIGSFGWFGGCPLPLSALGNGLVRVLTAH